MKTWLAIGVFTLAAAPVMAGNGPDRGEGSVCDDAGLIGSAYAACHTYCESLDCDAPVHTASDRACERALARFLDLTDGAQPPCLEEEEEEAPGCVCSPGWKDLDLEGSGWEPSGCDIYPSGEGGSFVIVYGSDAEGLFTQLWTGWNAGASSLFLWTGASCGWSASSNERGKDGQFALNDQVPAGETPDLGSYSTLYEDCLSKIEHLLETFGMSLEDCTTPAP